MSTTHIARCPGCGTPCYEPNGQCPLCNCVFTPIAQDATILAELDRGYTGAERADRTMERAFNEIKHLREMARQLQNQNLELSLKNAELLGGLQAYKILDAAGRVNHD